MCTMPGMANGDPGSEATFTIARNPDADSKLPYLLRLPLPGGPLVLKAGSCQRRGVAIDLVLDRARENRSQVVFTTIRGREGIFWQSPRTTRRARPGVRIPGRRASGLADVVVLIDSRERYPYRFARQAAETLRQALPAGDYGVEVDGEVVAVVERKSLADLSHSLVDGTLAYAMAELAMLDRAAVVVEDRYGALFKLEHVSPVSLPTCSAPSRPVIRRFRSCSATPGRWPRSGPSASSEPPWP